MTREFYKLLCQKHTIAVGEVEFRSEVYIGAFLRDKDNMYNSNCETTGRCISGGKTYNYDSLSL